MPQPHYFSEDEVLEKILQAPVRLRPYSETPELVTSHLVRKQGEPVPEIILHELGSTPKKTSSPAMYEHMPDMVINELLDLVMHDGVLYSKQPSILPDSVRIFDQHLERRMFYGPTSRMKHLGRGFYVPDNPGRGLRLEKAEGIFMPCFTSHQVYGHWLLEGLTALWALPYVRRLAGKAPVKLLLSPVGAVPQYMKRFASHFGVSEHDFYFPSRSLRCPRVFMPTKAYMHMSYATDFAKDIWATVAKAEMKKSAIHPHDKIYISRSRVKTRRLENEEECEAFFARMGFTIVHPQLLPLEDQILLFAKASHIVGPAGSAVHNVVFSRNPALKTFFFAPEDYSSFNAISVLERAFGREAYVLKGPPRTATKRSWSLSIKELRIAVDQWLAA